MKLKKYIDEIDKKLGHLNPWLVGGAARYIDGKSKRKIKDLDIIVNAKPPQEFILSERNHFKGFKMYILGKIADVWIYDVADYLTKVPTAWDGIAINLKSNTIITTSAYHSKKNFLILHQSTFINPNIERFKEHLENQELSIKDLENLLAKR